MYVLNADTIRDAYRSGIRYLKQYGIEQGNLLVSPCPVTIVTSKPRERVLFDPLRDVNPFETIVDALRTIVSWRDLHHCADRQSIILITDDRDVTAFFQLRIEREKTVLDLTVCARSGDAVEYVHGTDFVCLSVLQEYLAAGAGVEVGRMYQVVNNYFAYRDVLDRVWPWDGRDEEPAKRYQVPLRDPPRPIVTNFVTFDRELDELLKWTDDGQFEHVLAPLVQHWRNEWLRDTALPMMHAYAQWNSREFSNIRGPLARSIIRTRIKSEDWQLAAMDWTARRMKTYEVLGEPETTLKDVPA